RLVRAVHARPPAAVALGLVHRQVGELEEAFRRPALAPLARADAGAGRSAALASGPVAADHAQLALRDALRPGQVRARQDHGELVSTDARGRVDVAQTAHDLARDVAQAGVTGQVPVNIVGPLEPVQVDRQQAQRRAEPAGPLHLVLERL